MDEDGTIPGPALKRTVRAFTAGPGPTPRLAEPRTQKKDRERKNRELFLPPGLGVALKQVVLSPATTVGRTLKTDNPCNALKKPECVDICIVQSSFLFRCGIQEGRRTDVIEEIQVDCGLILFPLLYDYKSTNFWRPRHKSFRIGSPPIHSHCDAK